MDRVEPSVSELAERGRDCYQRRRWSAAFDASRWVMDELLDRLAKQLDLPPPQMKVCRGRMFSRIDYEIDVKQWGFADVGGEGEWRNE